MGEPRLGVGIAIPQAMPDAPLGAELAARHLDQVRAVARRAEEVGFEGGWVAEQIVGTRRRIEPVVLLSYVAAVTSRLRLGCSVFILPYRAPVTFAKQLASLDLVSGGRLTVGLGLGASDELAPAFGVSRGRRAARFSEAVAVMDQLWRGDEVRFAGEFFRLDGVQIDGGPVQRPRPRLWLGGHAEGALRRAVRVADGWMGAGASDAAVFAEQLATVRRLLEEEGRDPATFALSKRVYVSVDEDVERARARAADAGLATSAIAGRPEEVHARVEELLALGLDHLLLDPVAEHVQHVEALAPLASRGTG
jgi:probable F420-dependent oxidoreductase